MDDPIHKLTGQNNWERSPELTIGSFHIKTGVFYNIAAIAGACLLFYNFVLWILIPLMIAKCDDDVCTYVAIALCVVYVALAVPFTVFIGALVYNTIWRRSTLLVMIVLLACLPFLALMIPWLIYWRFSMS